MQQADAGQVGLVTILFLSLEENIQTQVAGEQGREYRRCLLR